MNPLHKTRTRLSALAALLAPLVFPVNAAPIPMTGTGSHSENFDSLPNTEDPNVWTNDTTLPGWYSNQTVLRISSGSLNSGALYSFGATDATERALGSVASGSQSPVFGIVLQNADSQPVEISSIAYTGEQWRSGTVAANTLSFGFLVSASPIESVADLILQSVTSLNFTGPIVVDSGNGALDGNLPENQVAVSASTQFIVGAGEYVLLLWSDVNDAGSDQGLAIDDLTINWQPSTGADTTPPAITALSPTNGNPAVTIESVAAGEDLIATFSENIQADAGDILIRQASNDEIVESIDVTDFNRFFAIDNQAIITLGTSLFPGISYYVEIPDGALVDFATPPNPFAGTGTDGWTFTVAAPPEIPTVVINKFLNGTPDLAELLVIGAATPGSTLDMTGMIIKDFSASMNTDGGGKHTFTEAGLWTAVPVGTLIVLSNTDSSPDTDPSDYTLRVGLLDPVYFEPSTSGSFDIAATEMVMIKEAGSDPLGVAGGIHALAGGPAGTQFNNFTGAKLLASLGSGTNLAVAADNAGSVVGDFVTGTASGSLPLSLAAFGFPSNGPNAAFISTLRGLTPGDGDGTAIVVNSTEGSPFLGRGFFDKGQSGQSATVVLNAFVPSVTLTNVTIEVPAALGTPSGATISGPGSTGAAISVAGQTITINSAAVTTTDALEVKIDGLSTPVPTLPSDNGNIPFQVSTRASSGTLAPMNFPPVARVIIPISSIRDIDDNGVALDAGTIVAVEGVVTEADFGSGTSNFSGFIQDETAGVNIFSPGSENNPNLVRGNRVAVVGPVIQFFGLTEVAPASAADVIDLGAGAEPTPVVLTIPQLLADAERYEGSLVSVAFTSRAEGSANAWATATTIVLRDAAANTLAIRIQSGSTALPEPAYPVLITGVLGQFDNSSPFTAGYQLMPRDPSDFTPIEPGEDDYSVWALANGLTPGVNDGPEFDAEPGGGDGIPNVLEFILGGNPLVSDRSILPTAEVDDTHFIFIFNRNPDSLPLTTQTFQWGTGLGFPEANNVPIGTTDSETNGVTVTLGEGGLVTIRVPRGSGTVFGRLEATLP